MPTSRAASSTCSTARSSRSAGAPPEPREFGKLDDMVTMWRNYWTVAVRSLAKNRTYSIINIAGLAIGMAACIMILLYVRYERSYDNWLPNAENTYQLQAWYPHPESGDPLFSQMSAYVSKGAI